MEEQMIVEEMPRYPWLHSVLIMGIVIGFGIIFWCLLETRRLLARKGIIAFNKDGWEKNLHAFATWRILNPEDRTVTTFTGLFGFPISLPILLLVIIPGYYVIQYWPLVKRLWS